MVKKTKVNGTVKWFDVRRGYGFITDEDGVDCYVHYTNIQMEGFKKLRAGQKVEFTPGEEDDTKRSTALEVVVIEENETTDR